MRPNCRRYSMGAGVLSVLFAVWSGPGLADTKDEPSLNSPKVQKQIIREMHMFKAGEADALLDIVTSCRADQDELVSEALYKNWDKNCSRATTIWNAKFSQGTTRELDRQLQGWTNWAVGILDLYFAGQTVQEDGHAIALERQLGDYKAVIQTLKKLDTDQQKLRNTVTRWNDYLGGFARLMQEARK